MRYTATIYSQARELHDPRVESDSSFDACTTVEDALAPALYAFGIFVQRVQERGRGVVQLWAGEQEVAHYDADLPRGGWLAQAESEAALAQLARERAAGSAICQEWARKVDFTEAERDQARAIVGLRTVETAYTQAYLDAAWATCAQLAAALRDVQKWGLDLSYVPEWDEKVSAALALVQPQCNHPLSAIGGGGQTSGGTRYCRACAAQAEVAHE